MTSDKEPVNVDFGGSTLAFSSDGKHLAASRDEGTINVWDTVAMAETLVISEPVGLDGNSAAVLAVVYSPDGRYILSSSADGTARIWDATTGQQVRVFSTANPLSTGLAWSPDGKQVATGGSDNLLRLWDAQTGQQLKSFDNGAGDSPTHGVQAIVYAPDGKTVAASAGAGNVEIWVWDLASGTRLYRLPGQTGISTKVAFSPDSKTLLTNSDSALRLWDAATGQQLRVFRGLTGGVGFPAFSPDGQAGGGRLWRWDCVDVGRQQAAGFAHFRGARERFDERGVLAR